MHYLAQGTSSLGWGPQGLGLGYPTGAAILTSLLVIVFLIWKTTGLPFDINRINTFRGEALFWTAILISNTLGTSMGDVLSDSSGLGHLGGAVLITTVLAVLAGCTKIRWVPNVLVFWFAFVLTRPLGAAVSVFFTKPAVQGGLGLGTYGASAVLLAILAGLMTHSTIRQHRQTTGVTQA